MNENEVRDLLRELVRIPAPLNKEEARARFCAGWLKAHGVEEIAEDEAGNVIAAYHLQPGKNNIAFTAHLDTVFSEDTELNLREQDGRWYCPGIGDDTANAAVMMCLMEKIWREQPDTACGVLFVLDTGEEGLGNLRGCRQMMQDFEGRLKAVISFDLYQEELYTNCIGSIRYELSVTTDGGHSYHKFGEPNAIAVLAEILTELYKFSPEQDAEGKTTYNVGTICGGTSVNTIAQDASCLFEYRSGNTDAMRRADRFLQEVLAKFRGEKIQVSCRVIGERPCSGAVNPEAQAELAGLCMESIKKAAGITPAAGAASTDCNIPLSLGIPAACVGLIRGGGAHTKEEWIEADSLEDGLKIAGELFRRITSGTAL